MNTKFLLFFALFITLLSNAQKIGYTAYDKVKRMSKSDSTDIRIYSSPSSVNFKYKEIGLLTVDDRGWGKSENKLLEIAIIEAKKRGADGLMILNQDNKVDGYYYGMAFNRKVLRLALVVKEEEENNPK